MNKVLLSKEEIEVNKYKDLKILHLGSLMLSEENGKTFAQKVAEKAQELGVNSLLI